MLNRNRKSDSAVVPIAGLRRTLVLMALIGLTLPLVAACGSQAPPVSPSSTPAVSSPAPAPTITHYYLSGRVTTDDGAPIADAVVEVDHGRAGGSSTTSNCPSFGAFCWISTRTNANGGYAMEFDSRPFTILRYAIDIGYVYAFADGYETNIQWVPPGAPTPIQDLPLRRARAIRPGDATSLSVEPTSSICSDLEDWWVLDKRCEVVQIEVSQAGTLVVDVRAAGGSVVPYVFWATTGNYTGTIARPGPSTVSIPVGGGTYRIFVGIPDGTATQRFDVETSLR